MIMMLVRRITFTFTLLMIKLLIESVFFNGPNSQLLTFLLLVHCTCVVVLVVLPQFRFRGYMCGVLSAAFFIIKSSAGQVYLFIYLFAFFWGVGGWGSCGIKESVCNLYSSYFLPFSFIFFVFEVSFWDSVRGVADLNAERIETYIRTWTCFTFLLGIT